jgi:hypothetical protein
MKFSQSLRIAALAAAAISLISSTATADLQNPLLIQTSPSVASARVVPSGDKVYVTGRVAYTHGRPVTQAAHVDVQLLGSRGQVIAEVQDSITPMHPRISRLRNGQYPYTVSFPSSQVAVARQVVVQYHSTAHGS